MNVLLLATVAVTQIASPIKVDGRLDEAAWKGAAWCSDFRRPESEALKGALARKTSFAILADARCVYVGVRCEEPDLGRLRDGDQDQDLWGTDDVELFFAPSGSNFDFYHFAASPVSTSHYADFASEGGNIHPDPFGTTWSSAFAYGDGEWTGEFAIPLASLYMTRNADWQTEWVFNITRSARQPKDRASWSPVDLGYLEPKRFGRVGGFPMRKAEDDFAMSDVRLDGANLAFSVYSAVAGDGTFEVPQYGTAPVRVALKAGYTDVQVPVAYPENGRYRTRLRCTRASDGAVFERTWPVSVDLTPIRVKLTTPAYRNNFYPGQKAETVEGSVMTLDRSDAEVTIEGPGFRKQTAKVKNGGTFSFDVRGFETGDAKLTVRTAKDESVTKVRNLPPTGHTMVWVEDGHLVVDGKSVLRRNLYGPGYRGGRKMDEKYRREYASFHATPAFERHIKIQIDDLVPVRGIERKEATKDKYPCKEYLAALDKVIEKLSHEDFGHYYLSDEPECRGLSRVFLRHVYEYVAAKDPYHPMLMASRGGKAYLDCVDWVETHPYICPRNTISGERKYGRNPSDIGRFLDNFDCGSRPDKVVGFLPTCFGYIGVTGAEDYPTFGEYVLHTYAAMSHGGKSLWPYAYHDLGDRPALYFGTKYLFESFEALQDLFLFAKRTDVRRGADFDIVTYSLGDDTLLLVMNYTRKDLEVKLPSGLGTLREFRGARTVKGGDTVKLGMDEVLVATAKPHDAGLRPLADVAAEIAREERARRSRDNQLVERYGEVTFKSNCRRGVSYKLIDGMYDQQALYFANAKGNFLDVRFKEGFSATFDRVVLHGAYRFDGAEPSVMRNGSPEKLAVAKREKTDDYRLVLTLERPCTATEGLRLDFPGETELYEIELPKVK